jgi:2,4-dienoyl-CoA reductase-like NADH-dependent reductase (Old Yellow Enzyme family)
VSWERPRIYSPNQAILTRNVLVNHPGRQSPLGAGNRGFFSKTVAPSAVPLNLGDGIIATLLRALMFGTPRALETAEIDVIIQQFVDAGKLAYDSGFQGVEIHGAHGYLLGLSLFHILDT